MEDFLDVEGQHGFEAAEDHGLDTDAIEGNVHSH